MRGFKLMSKFIKRIILFVVIVMSILYLYNAAYIRIGLYESDPNFAVTKFDSVPDKIDICNFGNSLGVDAFEDYDGVDGKCFNFALAAQSLSYDYRIMKQYKNSIGSDSIVFITLYYFCFQTFEEAEDNFQSKNERYYYFLKPEYIKEFNFSEYAYIKTFPVLWQTPVTIIQKTQKYIEQKNDNDNTEEFIDYKQSAIDVYESKNVIGDDGNLVVNKEELEALYGMLDLCNNNGAKPIIIITPYRREYTDLFSEEFYNQYFDLIEDACYQYECELYDYSRDENFSDNDSYFADAYHLSLEGSNAFLEMINKDILEKYR